MGDQNERLGPYRKLYQSMYADDKFLGLSPVKPSGQSLWIYLLTGPHMKSVPGVSTIGELELTEKLRWPLRDLRRCWKEVRELGLAKSDWHARVIWIPKAVIYNRPESANVVRSWRLPMSEIPACSLKNEALAGLQAFVEGLHPSFGEAWAEAFGEGIGRPSGKASGKPSGKA